MGTPLAGVDPTIVPTAPMDAARDRAPHSRQSSDRWVSPVIEEVGKPDEGAAVRTEAATTLAREKPKVLDVKSMSLVSASKDLHDGQDKQEMVNGCGGGPCGY